MSTVKDRRNGAIVTRNKPSVPGEPFQPEIEKAQPGGYASLDGSNALIPTNQLGTGVAAAGKALLGDQTWGDIATQVELDAETAARIAADNAEAVARANADTALQVNITAEATTRAANDTTETNARTAADTTLQTNITNEATTRANADTAEATARAAADALLLVKASNLSDVASVATSRTNLGLKTGATTKIDPTAWVPTFLNLTEVVGGGTITKTGRCTRIGDVVMYDMEIVCTGGATTAAVLNSTQCNNPPFTISKRAGGVSLDDNMVNVGPSLAWPGSIYLGAWTARSNRIMVFGWYFTDDA